MRWQTALTTLAVTCLLTSCATSAPFVPPTARGADASCWTPCRDAPTERNPPRLYIQDLLRWGYDCTALHDECVVSNSDKL